MIDPLFGKYCYIDTPWIAGEKTIYKIVRSGARSNGWREVPVKGRGEVVVHDWSEDVVYVVLDTLIDETTGIEKFALKDIELIDEPNSSENPNNCESKICDICRYYNSNIPCGSTPSACKEADKFAKEFEDGLKKLKPKTEPQTVKSNLEPFRVDEPQTDYRITGTVGYRCPKCGRGNFLKSVSNCVYCGEPLIKTESHPTADWMTLDDAYYLVYKDLTKMDGILTGKYDAKNGKKQFMNGVWTVMELIAYGVGIDCYEAFNERFCRNLEKSTEQTEEPPMDEYYKDHDEFYDCDRYVVTNDEGERAYNCIGCEQTDCAWKKGE